MTKTPQRIFFIGLVYTIVSLIGLTSQRAFSAPVARTSTRVSIPARETAIDRLVVSLFKANVRNPNYVRQWNKNREEFQQIFVGLLNEQSYLEAVASTSEYALNEDQDLITDEARDSGVDGVLVGEYRGTTLELGLRSGATGRTLARWTVPAGPLTDQGNRQTIALAIKTVVLGFPYRGFIQMTKGNEARLNLGRRQGIRVGTDLEIFEFAGNKPTFSSATVPMGTVRVTKLSGDAAIGTVTRVLRPITPYSKVAFSKMVINSAADQEARTRYHTKLWAYMEGEYNAIDTQISDDYPSLKKRMYQLPISPSIAFGLGYSKLALNAAVGAASNASNKVSFLQGTITYELTSRPWRKYQLLTSVGAFYSQYTADVQPGADFPLISTKSYSPWLEERIQLQTSIDTRLFIAGALLYPIFSSDAENGNSSPATSYGFNFQGGIRINLSNVVAIESGAQGRYTRINFQSGTALVETQYGFFARGLFTF